MAREFAQIKLAIWADDDWRDLSPLARYLYLTLLTSPTLSHCGVADWRPARIAALNGMTPYDVEEHAAELIEALYLVIDEKSEEVLIRSFVRNDGLMKQPKMAVAMASAHAAVASQDIRGVIVHELQRLREDMPTLSGWGSERATELLGMRSVDPSTYPLGKGSRKGNRTPIGKGSAKGCPTPAPTPTPNILAPSEFVEAEDNPRSADAASPPASKSKKKPSKPLPADWRPTEDHLVRCRDLGIDPALELAKFRAHAEANDRRQVNWNAAFTQWLLNARPGNVRPLRPEPDEQGRIPLPPLPSTNFWEQR